MSEQDQKDDLFRRYIAEIRRKPSVRERLKPLVLSALLIVALVLVAWMAAVWVTSSGAHPERFQ